MIADVDDCEERSAGSVLTAGAGRTPCPAPAVLAELLRSAESVVALTGAGISAPSGIPDFRGRAGIQKGLWENANPMEVAPLLTHRGGGRVVIVTQGPTPLDELAELRLHGDVVGELEGLLEALELS